MAEPRRVCFVTGARSEYDLMSPIMRAVDKHPDMHTEVLVGGAHLSPFHGMNIDNIRGDGFEVVGEIESLLSSESWVGRALSFSNLFEGATRHFAGNRPDVVFVTGDREEALAGALAAVFQKIPVAHHFGGDKCIVTELDELLRPTISKLAHLHFTATESHRQRLIRMGEAEDRIWTTGGTGLDRLRTEPDLSDEELSLQFGIDVRQPFFLLIHHPSPLINPEEGGQEMSIILESMLSLGHPVLCSYPNFDPGNMAIRSAIDEAKAKSGLLTVFHTLPRRYFVALFRRTSALVGNSSSIVIEAGFLKVPGVLIGPRQDLREVSPSVQRIDAVAEQVRAACLRCIADPDFLELVRNSPSIYGDGHAADRIASILAQVELGPELFCKLITY